MRRHSGLGFMTLILSNRISAIGTVLSGKLQSEKNMARDGNLLLPKISANIALYYSTHLTK